MKLLPFKLNGPLLLALLSGGIALYLTLTSLFHLWEYFRLQERAPATLYQWRVVQKTSSAFALEAFYTFEAQGKTFLGQTLFSKPYHLNSFSAERQIKILSSNSWSIWYDTRDPTYSSLEKVFPGKQLFYALLTVGIFLYFLYVRYTVLVARSL